MPILYVHGIAIRKAGEVGWPEVQPFVESVAWPGIEEKLRQYVAPVLSRHPEQVVTEQVYWGNLGADPYFPNETPETLPPSQLNAAALAEELEAHVRREMPVQAWPEVIEAVWHAAHDQELRQRLLDLPAAQQWDTLHRATEAELRRRWHAAHPNQVWPWLAQFQQVFRRRLLRRVKKMRGPLEGFLPYFMGDILNYLAGRGTPEQPGPIPRRVLDSLAHLHDIKTRTGEPLVILTHSMGGQLMFDALSAFAPADPRLSGLHVDLWCASASQLALFSSLSRFVTPTDPDGTLPKPDNVSYLWNVWSPTDLLSFQATPAIQGAQDAALALTDDALKAHAEYLVNPAFYRALASKLRVVLAANREAAGQK